MGVAYMAVSSKFMKRQGTEGGRGSWIEHLQRLNQVVGGIQSQNPVYAPFPEGTPTLGGQQLIESAKQAEAALALQQAEMNRRAQEPTQPTIPDPKVMKYSLSNALKAQAEEEWSRYVQGKGLGSGEVPTDTHESEQWINKVMPGLKAGIYDLTLGYGGNTKEAEDMAFSIENYLRARAGLQTRLPNEQGQSAEDILEALRNPR